MMRKLASEKPWVVLANSGAPVDDFCYVLLSSTLYPSSYDLILKHFSLNLYQACVHNLQPATSGSLAVYFKVTVLRVHTFTTSIKNCAMLRRDGLPVHLFLVERSNIIQGNTALRFLKKVSSRSMFYSPLHCQTTSVEDQSDFEPTLLFPCFAV